jgi:hypothetical protein
LSLALDAAGVSALREEHYPTILRSGDRKTTRNGKSARISAVALAVSSRVIA